jgi:membrane associated rhomboid family serine protease
MEQKILKWLATSPVGGAVKMAFGFFVAYLAMEYSAHQNFDNVSWKAAAEAVVGGVVVVMFNSLNGQDNRYGKKSTEE